MSFPRAVRPATRLARLIALLAVAIAFVWISGPVALAETPSSGTSWAFAPPMLAWIEDFKDGYSTRSDIAVAVQEALDEAGIGVPFPQRDLHLVSVSPTAATDLRGEASRSPGPDTSSGSASHSGEES